MNGKVMPMSEGKPRENISPEPSERKYWWVYICDEWIDGWIPVPIDTSEKEG